MEAYILFILLGAASGLVAGLFGVGGGVIVVPALIFGFVSQGYAPEILTHMAVATSLAAMVVTAAASALAHHAKGSVDWAVFRWMAVGVLCGAIAGVAGSFQLKGEWIQIGFGLFLLIIGARVFLGAPRAVERSLPGNPVLGGVGSAIGAVSVVFGIGGGSMTVPFLLRFGMIPTKAVGTSSALGFPIAVLGGVLYAIQGEHALLPDNTVGFVYIPAFIGLVLLGIPFAKLGVTMAHRLPEQQLKRAFAVFVMLMAALLLVRNLG